MHATLHRLATLSIGLALSGIAFAQPFESAVAPASRAQIVEHQQAFEQWKQGKSLDEEKGWKYYARWLNFNEQRANPDGSLFYDYQVFDGATEAMRMQSTSASRGGSGWIPVGPVELPPGSDPTRQHGMGRINCIAFHPTDTNTFWVGVAQGGVWKTVDGGQNWQPLTDELPILRINDIAVDPNHPDTMYISVGDYAYLAVALALDDRKRNTHYGMGVFKSTDGGSTWNPTGLTYNQTDFDGSLIRRTFVDPDSSNNLLAAGIDGIWSSSDAGDTWQNVLDSVIWDIEADPNDPHTLFATGGYIANLGIGSACIMKSTDFGSTWTVLNSGIQTTGVVQRIEVAVAPSNSDYVYAIACGTHKGFEALYRSTDGGTSWQQRSSGNDINILDWSDGGNLHTGQGTYDLVLGVHPTNPDQIYAGGINMWASADGGQSWEGVSYWVGSYGPSLHADQHFFATNLLDQKHYICNDGGVYRTDTIESLSWDSIQFGVNWPTEWENLSGGLAVSSFYRLGLSNAHAGYTIGGAQDNSTFVRSGFGWLNIIGGDGMECARHPLDSNTIYGSTQYGGIRRSYNGGINVDYISWPILNQYDDEGEWTTPYLLHPTDPNIVLAGFGQVYRSDDAGDFWVPISNFPDMPGDNVSNPASALATYKHDPNVIYVAKRIVHSKNQLTTVWRTINGGSSWNNITAGLPDSLYITYLAVDDSDPFRVWATCSGFTDGAKVYRTDDGGDTWQNVSGNLPNLPANCIVHHDSSLHDQVYVGMDVGIYYTNDTMQTWEPYAENLPNVIVSELEIHYPSQSMYAATFGRGMWQADLLSVPLDTTSPDTVPVDTTPPAAIGSTVAHGLQISISPNPATSAFDLMLQGEPTANLDVEIIDINGRAVLRKNLGTFNGEQRYRLDVALPAGVYFLKVVADGRFKAKRLVVQ